MTLDKHTVSLTDQDWKQHSLLKNTTEYKNCREIWKWKKKVTCAVTDVVNPKWLKQENGSNNKLRQST